MKLAAAKFKSNNDKKSEWDIMSSVRPPRQDIDYLYLLRGLRAARTLVDYVIPARGHTHMTYRTTHWMGKCSRRAGKGQGAWADRPMRGDHKHWPQTGQWWGHPAAKTDADRLDTGHVGWETSNICILTSGAHKAQIWQTNSTSFPFEYPFCQLFG